MRVGSGVIEASGGAAVCRAESSGLVLALCLLGLWGCCGLEEGGDAPTSALCPVATRPTPSPWLGSAPWAPSLSGLRGLGAAVEWLTELAASGLGQILAGFPCCRLCALGPVEPAV